MHYLSLDPAPALPRLMERRLLTVGSSSGISRSPDATFLALAEADPRSHPEAAGLPSPSSPAIPALSPSGADLPFPPIANAPPWAAATESMRRALRSLERATRSFLARRRAPKTSPKLGEKTPVQALSHPLLLLDSFPEGLLTFDSSGAISAANPEAHRILKAIPGTLPGQSGERYFSGWPQLLQLGPSNVPLNAITDLQGHPLAVEGTFLVALQGGTLQRAALLRDLSEHVLVERNILRTSEQERRQIGQELYDGVVQQIAANKMLTQLLARQLLREDSPLALQAQKVAQNLHEALEQASFLVRGLVPLGVFDRGLAQALQRLAAQTQASSPARCLLICGEGADIADPEIALHLYLIAQEAVANALRHGQARTITLSLTREGTSALLSLVDDGVGFLDKSAPPHSGLGLRTIRHRAQLIGARLDILTSPQRGCQILCQLLHFYPPTPLPP